MKTLIQLLILTSFSLTVLGQAPNGFNYQGMALNANGDPLTNTGITVQISLLEGGASGVMKYQERHSLTTSDQGIFALVIGDGLVQSGSFSIADWKNAQYWVSVEMDPTGGTNFVPMGTQQLLSVPYALHAQTATNVDDADADPGNEIQTLSVNGSQLTISGGNTVNLPTGGGGGGNDDDPNNEIQDLSHSKNGSDIKLDISLGGQSTTFSVDDADSDPSNELQSLQLTGTEVSISGGNKIDLGPVSTPWRRDLGDIVYDQGGNVRIEDSNFDWKIYPGTIRGEELNAEFVSFIEPGAVSITSKQTNVSSQMNNGEFYVWDSGTDQLGGLHQNGLSVYRPECSAQLTAGQLSLEDTLGVAKTHYNKDSLYMFQSIGLLLPDAATLKPTHIKFETIASGLKSTLGPGAQRNYSGDALGEVGPRDIRFIDDIGGVFQRAIFSGDSLQMVNQAKWKNVDIRTSNQDGGSINLFGFSGAPTVTINSTWNAGNICTEGPNGFTNTCIGTSDNFDRGSISANNDIGFPVVEILADSLNRGSMAFTNQLKLAEEVWSDDPIFEVRRQATHSAFMSIDGENSENNVYAGYRTGHQWDGSPPPNLTRGEVSVGDQTGAFKAGIYVNEDDIGLSYVKQGSFNVIAEDNTHRGIWDEYNLNQYGPAHPASCVGRSNFYENTGIATFWGENGTRNVSILFDENAGEITNSNFGLITVLDNEDITRSWMSGTGELGGSGLTFKNIDGFTKLESSANFFGSGAAGMTFYGNNGNANVSISNTNNGNDGWIGVFDAGGAAKAGFFIDDVTNQGKIFADVKHFRMEHPSDPNAEIWYASLEGPEAGAYVRGTATLVQGEAFVPFPDHYREVCNPETMTIQLTPRHWDTYGLALVEVKADGFYVKELKGEKGNFDFDWEAKGVRKGHESFKAVLSKDEVSEALQVKSTNK